MKVVVGNKIINLTKKDYLNEGTETIVYKFGNIVIKLYHDLYNYDNLTINQILKLSKINTPHYVMPQELVKENGEVTGYSSKYIPSKNKIYLISKEKLINGLKNLYDEAKELGKNGIEIRDLRKRNIIVNDDIYVIDIGGFLFKSTNTLDQNYDQINKFITENIMTYICKKENKIESLNEIKKRLNKYKQMDIALDMQMYENESIIDYVRRV